MKICVTSQGPDLASEVDPRFGRARYFVVYDDEKETFETIDNSQNVNAAGGAGIQAATTVAENGCSWVLSGHMGPQGPLGAERGGRGGCGGGQRNSLRGPA